MDAVIFDMDGVIVDSNPYHLIALKEFFKRYNVSIDDQELEKNVFGRRNDEWVPEYFGKNLPDHQIKKFADEKEEYFRKIFKDEIAPLNGLRELLEDLKMNNIPAAIGSSAPTENVNFVLDELHIREYFSAVLDQTAVKNGKPEPDIFLKACSELKMNPSDCIVIEDSKAGITAGKKAGCKVIGISSTHTRDELEPITDDVFDDFTGMSANNFVQLF